MRLAAGSALLLLLAAGCSSERKAEPAPSPTPRVSAPRTLVAADLDIATLGAKIAGPKGTDPEFPVLAGGKEIARIRSFVACPKELTECVPDALPEGTVLTYVHVITPSAAKEVEATPVVTPAASTSATTLEVPPSIIRMTSPAPGFKGAVGFAKAEAKAALGDAEPIKITLDAGRLVWRVVDGSGWTPGAPVTVWWQTTVPPAGPQEVLRIELNGQAATAMIPFPAAEKPAGSKAAR